MMEVKVEHKKGGVCVRIMNVVEQLLREFKVNAKDIRMITGKAGEAL
ncbi:hypothetical protein ACPJHQ_04740 [Rossellomorea sp. H39__3]